MCSAAPLSVIFSDHKIISQGKRRFRWYSHVLRWDSVAILLLALLQQVPLMHYLHELCDAFGVRLVAVWLFGDLGCLSRHRFEDPHVIGSLGFLYIK